MKVAVTPCAGIGQIFGSITREAGYKIVEELNPEETVLVCPPALSVDIQEDINFIMDNPVLVLNGCKDRCATKLVESKGGKVAKEIYLPDIVSENKISLAGEKRSRLGEKSYKAVDAMAEKASKVIKKIVEGKEV